MCKICRTVTTAGDLESEVTQDDIEELRVEHGNDLTTEELQELSNEEHQETHRAVFSSEKRERRKRTGADICYQRSFEEVGKGRRNNGFRMASKRN